MTMANLPHFTSAAWVPFGLRACRFYNNCDGLVAALMPYLARLRGNKRLESYV